MSLDLILHSPNEADHAVFPWPLSDKGESTNEIIETLRWICKDRPEISIAMDRPDFNEYDPKSYDSMKKLCDKYNRTIQSLIKVRHKNDQVRPLPRPCNPLLKYIIQLAYNKSVSDPEKLNQYPPFSPQVYGETSYEFVSQLIREVPISEDDICIDLGSGVGQVVLQLAAATKCKSCIGIEISEVPATYAKKMDLNFRFWMNWFGKSYSSYELIQGDFLSSKFKDIIMNSTLLFVNNFAFGPGVDHSLKVYFAELRDGTRIVSSKAFCPSNFRISDRTLSDVGAMMELKEITPMKGSVSWTGKAVSYYLHTIDRVKLEKYFDKTRYPRLKRRLQGEEKGKKRGSGTNSEISVDSSSNDSKTDVFGGPTTRKVWSEIIAANNSSGGESNEENENVNKRIKLEDGCYEKKRSNPKRKPGRPKKRFSPKKPRRPPKGVALDLLHRETVLSTSFSENNKTPAPGCVDETHNTFQEPPEVLRNLMEVYMQQMMTFINQMKGEPYYRRVQKQIEQEEARKRLLMERKTRLEEYIHVLIKESTDKFKTRLQEIGIQDVQRPNELLEKAKEIVTEHKNLLNKFNSLSAEVNELEMNNNRLVKLQQQQQQSLLQKQSQQNGRIKVIEPMMVVPPAPVEVVNHTITKNNYHNSPLEKKKGLVQQQLEGEKKNLHLRKIHEAMGIQDIQDRVNKVISTAFSENSNTAKPLEPSLPSPSHIINNNNNNLKPSFVKIPHFRNKVIASSSMPLKVQPIATVIPQTCSAQSKPILSMVNSPRIQTVPPLINKIQITSSSNSDHRMLPQQHHPVALIKSPAPVISSLIKGSLLKSPTQVHFSSIIKQSPRSPTPYQNYSPSTANKHPPQSINLIRHAIPATSNSVPTIQQNCFKTSSPIMPQKRDHSPTKEAHTPPIKPFIPLPNSNHYTPLNLHTNSKPECNGNVSKMMDPNLEGLFYRKHQVMVKLDPVPQDRMSVNKIYKLHPSSEGIKNGPLEEMLQNRIHRDTRASPNDLGAVSKSWPMQIVPTSSTEPLKQSLHLSVLGKVLANHKNNVIKHTSVVRSSPTISSPVTTSTSSSKSIRRGPRTPPDTPPRTPSPNKEGSSNRNNSPSNLTRISTNESSHSFADNSKPSSHTTNMKDMRYEHRMPWPSGSSSTMHQQAHPPNSTAKPNFPAVWSTHPPPNYPMHQQPLPINHAPIASPAVGSSVPLRTNFSIPPPPPNFSIPPPVVRPTMPDLSVPPPNLYAPSPSVIQPTPYHAPNPHQGMDWSRGQQQQPPTVPPSFVSTNLKCNSGIIPIYFQNCL